MKFKKSEKGQSFIEVALGIVVVVFAILVVYILVLFAFIQPLANHQFFTATIDKTYIDDGNTYFVLDMPDGSLKPHSNEDNWYYGKFDSGDMIVYLETGKTYNFETVGNRIPFWSCFPNIITAEIVPEQ